jgi:hypothetical protein
MAVFIPMAVSFALTRWQSRIEALGSPQSGLSPLPDARRETHQQSPVPGAHSTNVTFLFGASCEIVQPD